MVFELKFYEFNNGNLNFDRKSLSKGLDLVTSRLYTKRDPDELVWSWGAPVKEYSFGVHSVLLKYFVRCLAECIVQICAPIHPTALRRP